MEVELWILVLKRVKMRKQTRMEVTGKNFWRQKIASLLVGKVVLRIVIIENKMKHSLNKVKSMIPAMPINETNQQLVAIDRKRVAPDHIRQLVAVVLAQVAVVVAGEAAVVKAGEVIEKENKGEDVDEQASFLLNVFPSYVQ